MFSMISGLVRNAMSWFWDKLLAPTGRHAKGGNLCPAYHLTLNFLAS